MRADKHLNTGKEGTCPAQADPPWTAFPRKQTRKSLLADYNRATAPRRPKATIPETPAPALAIGAIPLVEALIAEPEATLPVAEVIEVIIEPIEPVMEPIEPVMELIEPIEPIELIEAVDVAVAVIKAAEIAETSPIALRMAGSVSAAENGKVGFAVKVDSTEFMEE